MCTKVAVKHQSSSSSSPDDSPTYTDSHRITSLYIRVTSVGSKNRDTLISYDRVGFPFALSKWPNSMLDPMGFIFNCCLTIIIIIIISICGLSKLVFI